MSERVFLQEPYKDRGWATVTKSAPDGITLDRTIFYPRGGGQPGDAGVLKWDGVDTPVIDTIKGEDSSIVHVPAPGAKLPRVGGLVWGVLDWQRRYAHMRMHTALHLLCSLIKGAAVTGGAVAADKSRLDFDLPNPPPKEEIEALLNTLIAADHTVTIELVDESLLDTNPEIVRTMSVQPPRGMGQLRLIRIGDEHSGVDLQPCGGTHVARTGEIGPIRVLKIENKGKQNRRITIAFAEPA